MTYRGESEGITDGRCSHCQRTVRADLGVENSAGEILCGACFKVLGNRTPKRTIPRGRIDALERIASR
jgi:hypothetical protein